MWAVPVSYGEWAPGQYGLSQGIVGVDLDSMGDPSVVLPGLGQYGELGWPQSVRGMLGGK